MTAGKGDSPRNNYSNTFRDNYDRIFGKLAAGLNAMQMVSKPMDEDVKELRMEKWFKKQIAEFKREPNNGNWI